MFRFGGSEGFGLLTDHLPGFEALLNLGPDQVVRSWNRLNRDLEPRSGSRGSGLHLVQEPDRDMTRSTVLHGSRQSERGLR